MVTGRHRYPREEEGLGNTRSRLEVFRGSHGLSTMDTWTRVGVGSDIRSAGCVTSLRRKEGERWELRWSFLRRLGTTIRTYQGTGDDSRSHGSHR